MKNLIALVCAATMSIAVAGCNNSAPNLAQFVTQVQNAAILACGFLPAVETVAAIFSANSTLPVTQVADAICKAVQPPLGHPGANPSKVVIVGNTVIPVKGQFVEGDHAVD